ncbi:alpha/beta hydrolase [Microlunatus aurantiacus]|uniref:Alpha/beta hydrolase n=1 Tax=Microlunatus aurantiacus TaxID=446786 RepID=A0ABP7DEC9_9ACTN
MLEHVTWEPDILDGFESLEIGLPEAARAPGEPADTEVVATLVRRAGGERSRHAVLFVHGWNDYFFATHVADVLSEAGFAFYAIDLRRYGRSLRLGQLRGFIADLTEYDQELSASADLIAADHEELTLLGHSTGGLTATLWAADHPERVAGVILNSPWLDLQGSAMVRALGGPVIDAVGGNRPTAVIPLPDSGFYARTIHLSQEGEWDYDTELKTSPSPAIRVGWLRAVLQGHQKVAAGLGLPMPVLVMTSSRTDFARKWHEGLREADTVLDVEQIARRATRLGRHVTIVRFEGGLHDLFLSRRDVREQVFDELRRWSGAYLTGAGPVLSDAGL